MAKKMARKRSPKRPQRPRRDRRREYVQFCLLDAIFKSPSGAASLGKIEGRKDCKYRDGGQWRGAAIRELSCGGLIERCGAEKSNRASRHGTIVSTWRIKDRAACQKLHRHLKELLGKH